MKKESKKPMKKHEEKKPMKDKKKCQEPDMTKLTTKKRNSLPKSEFAGADRSYPVNDKAHAANAKSRATQMEKKGKLSASAKSKIDAKANKVLGTKKEGMSHVSEKRINAYSSRKKK